MMNKYTERLHNGIIKENPTFVMMLGMCPTLAVTSSAINAIGMGLSTAVVLTLSNMMISALRNISCTYSGIYRRCCVFRNDCAAAFKGISAGT